MFAMIVVLEISPSSNERRIASLTDGEYPKSSALMINAANSPSLLWFSNEYELAERYSLARSM